MEEEGDWVMMERRKKMYILTSQMNPEIRLAAVFG